MSNYLSRGHAAYDRWADDYGLGVAERGEVRSYLADMIADLLHFAHAIGGAELADSVLDSADRHYTAEISGEE